jgi:hypothetical protein
MAKPIKITPVLRGQDALNFLSKIRIDKHQNSDSSSKLSEIKKDANRFKALIKKA